MPRPKDDPEADVDGALDVLEFSSDDAVENSLRPSAEKQENDNNWNWEEDPSNPYNWPAIQKVLQVMMIGWAAFTTLVNPHTVEMNSDLMFDTEPLGCPYCHLPTRI